MSERIPVILIYDIGKTNKKILLFDKKYHVVFEKSIHFVEIADKDGFLSEDIKKLTEWVKSEFLSLLNDKNFYIEAINFSGYGASFVLLDHSMNLLEPLYNYLKPYPQQLLEKFYSNYGGEETFSTITASPVLGSLNSGLQLYRFKHEDPSFFNSIKYAIHLPQYLSYILSGSIHSEITSIGCHTGLWNFNKHDYHDWVYKEGIEKKLGPIVPSNEIAGYVKDIDGTNIPVGVGLHDSSAALIPYQQNFDSSFVLLSTGTWSISMNPFNQSILTQNELKQDCLCYLSYTGKQIKSSRLFSGHMHDESLKELNKNFNVVEDTFKYVDPVKEYSKNSFEYAYVEMIDELIKKQVISTNLILTENEKNIFVDGGFSKNNVFMKLLAKSYPGKKVFAAEIAQASALGAALAMHKFWNDTTIDGSNLIQIQRIFLT